MEGVEHEIAYWSRFGGMEHDNRQSKMLAKGLNGFGDE